MSELYPLKFHPIYKDKIWGGQKIKTILEKDFGNLPNCGESWLISGVNGDISVVNGGKLDGKILTDIIRQYKDRLLGQAVYQKFGERFPLLIKFIDANDDLSVQVHPDDKLAEKRHQSFGKTEMWFVVQADKGAKLITGFNQPMDKNLYLKAFNEGRLFDILNQEEVSEEDMFFIPAGRVHTIGKGILLAEIQQTSDITYRIYDFDRKDNEGNTRELHVEEALDAIDYTFHEEYKTKYEAKTNKPVHLATCSYFNTHQLQLTKPLFRDFSKLNSFVIYICYQGTGQIQYGNQSVRFEKGDAILIPAEIKNIQLVPENQVKLLETYVPES